MASDFDAIQNAALRKRRFAEMLQQQAVTPDAPLTTPGARMSWLNPLAKMIQGGTGAYMGAQADAADIESAQARQAALTKLLGEMPQGTPAVPANAPAPAPGETEGVGPVQPAQPAVPASPQEMAAYGAKFLPLGPAAAKVGEQFTDAAVKQMLPKPPPSLMAVGGDVFDPTTRTFISSPTKLAEQAAIHQERQDKLQQAADVAKQRSEDMRYSVDQRAEAARQHNDLMRELRASGAAGEKGNMVVEGASESGNPVVRHSRTGVAYEVVNGVPSTTPYAGPVTPKTEQAKGVASAAKGSQGLKDMTNALNAVEEDDALFGKRANLGAALPSAFGTGAAVSGLSEKQMAKKAQISSMTADITHSLYGSAFSAGEQARAKSFLIDPLDSTDVVKSKLRGRMELEKEHYDNLPASAKSAATAQRGGAAPAGGKNVTVDY
jgi:hypothetical protein